MRFYALRVGVETSKITMIDPTEKRLHRWIKIASYYTYAHRLSLRTARQWYLHQRCSSLNALWLSEPFWAVEFSTSLLTDVREITQTDGAHLLSSVSIFFKKCNLTIALRSWQLVCSTINAGATHRLYYPKVFNLNLEYFLSDVSIHANTVKLWLFININMIYR